MNKAYDESELKTRQKQGIVTPRCKTTPLKSRNKSKPPVESRMTKSSQVWVQHQPSEITQWLYVGPIFESYARLSASSLSGKQSY